MLTKIQYTPFVNPLKKLYEECDLESNFAADNLYLEKAFEGFTSIWLHNLNQIKYINYLIIAEAPLWGDENKYFYNPKSQDSQFFYKSDLEYAIEKRIAISDKFKLIEECNKLGILIIDISPYALNTINTSINYSKNAENSLKIKNKQYQKLIKSTIEFFFEKKLYAIREKFTNKTKVYFRYAGVKKNFEADVLPLLKKFGLIQNQKDIEHISIKGGGLDKGKLKTVIEQAP